MRSPGIDTFAVSPLREAHRSVTQQVPPEPTEPRRPAGAVVPGGQAPGKPADEADRLAELRSMGVLESGPNADLDALVDMAALIAGSPIALITLVDDDEQIFKATYGLDAPGTSRDVSFCGHAIAAGHEPLVVPDSREDPRFADNPLVTGDPHIIFYAGIPLVTGAGHAIGTLCVVDDTPRTLEPRQLEALGHLASQATGLIELARRNRTLGESADPRTGLPMRDELVADMSADGPLHPPASAIAIRVTEISGGAQGGGLLAEGALPAVAQALAECLPGSARMARAFGMFLVVLPGVDGARTRSIVTAMRERLHGAIVPSPDSTVRVGLTAGVARAADGAPVDAGDLLLAAEDALATAAPFGNAFANVDGGDPLGSRARAQVIRGDLSGAVQSGQLVVHYQPIVRLVGAEWVGAEALVRWQHPELGLVMPDEFVPFAEDMDLIGAIDEHVLRVALHDLAAGRVPGHEVSVNVSPGSLRDGLPNTVASELWDAGVDPARLVLEVTERLRVDREAEAIAMLREVADLGVRVAVDDFGAGTTSLAHLRELPVARLKLDRALVSDLDGPDARRAALVVRALAQLAADLEVEVLAEGVETPAQAEMLMAQGVGLGQGYLFGRPSPLSGD